MHKPNNILEADVRDQIDWDFRIDGSRIVVKAKDGRVTLSGSVPTFYESALTEEDTWGVGGVTAVDNEVLVGLVGSAIADVDIEAACARALDADKFVPKGAVSAFVSDGWVTLTGEVRHHFQRQAAEHAVRKVDGVLGLTDKVGISSEPIPTRRGRPDQQGVPTERDHRRLTDHGHERGPHDLSRRYGAFVDRPAGGRRGRVVSTRRRRRRRPTRHRPVVK